MQKIFKQMTFRLSLVELVLFLLAEAAAEQRKHDANKDNYACCDKDLGQVGALFDMARVAVFAGADS